MSLLIAENNISITYPLFAEGSKAIRSDSYKKMIRNISLVLLALVGILTIWLLLNHISLFYLLGEGIFLGAIMIWLTVILPSTKTKGIYKTMSRFHSFTPKRKISFYEDRIHISGNSGEESDFSYEDITCIKETTHLYILITQTQQGILLSKEGFTYGDYKTLFHSKFSNFSQ